MKRFAPACFAAITMGLERVEVDRRRELLVKLEAGVVGDACQIDHRLDAFERTRQFPDVPDCRP